MANSVDAIAAALSGAHIAHSGVSFAGKGLKLNNENDAVEVVEAIAKCKDLYYLNLEGNTLGIDAAVAIAGALEKHGEFKRALWKDMFTGRMKNEIPKALEHLGCGLVKSGARLTELDLSDNAFGPIGVQGLASLLKSSCCYALEELRLNNNGLGISGAKLLAASLMDCYNASNANGKPLSLKVFIAGRNRLENEGATVLAKVFKTIQTLEEVQIPQNGIYHVGISELSNAFKCNPNLKIINLNDNTIGPVGARALSTILPNLEHLKVINFGDCLLKTKGATAIAAGLANCTKLEELILDANEIKIQAAKEVIAAVGNKTMLKKVSLNGNAFGESGIAEIKDTFDKMGKLKILESLSEDEGDSDEEDSEECENEEEDSDSHDVSDINHFAAVTIDEFLSKPSAEAFMALGENRSDLLLKAAMENSEEYLSTFISVLMKVASLTKLCKEPALKCCELLYRELFSWSQKHDQISIVNNTLLVHLGLIKSEDKKFKPQWDLVSCLAALEYIVDKNYFPDSTRNSLKTFIKRDIDNQKEYTSEKRNLLKLLN